MRKSNGKMKKSIAIIVSLVVVLSLTQLAFAAGYVQIFPSESIKYGASFNIPQETSSGTNVTFKGFCNDSYGGAGLYAGLYKYNSSTNTWESITYLDLKPYSDNPPLVGKVQGGKYRIVIFHKNSSNRSAGGAALYW